MDYDPVVLVAVHSSAKELIIVSVFKEQAQPGSALLFLPWVSMAAKSP